MRLFNSKIASLASDVVAALRAAGDIEITSPSEVEKDVTSVLSQYLRADQEASDHANDLLQQRGLPSSEFNRLKRLSAEQKGIKVGDEVLDYLLDQVVEILFHSSHVEEVFAEDHDLRRRMVPFFKKYMAVDEEVDREIRGKIKHVQEGTSNWEVEYQRVMGDIKRRKGLA